MKIGLIGFGRLGKLITKYMSQDATVLIYEKNVDNPSDYEEEVRSLGATAASLEEVCKCPIVIPFVPISEFENCIFEIKDLLKDDSLIVDVCSVKSWPVEVMTKHLKKSISILATHPMFGPDSAKSTLYGCKIVLCPERIEDEKFQNIKSYLETHGLKTIVTTAKEHDEQISRSLVLTHLIGRTLLDFKASSLDVDTKGYRRLMKILETVENDSWQLFQDMNTYNPYSKSTREEFLSSMQAVLGKIEE